MYSEWSSMPPPPPPQPRANVAWQNILNNLNRNGVRMVRANLAKQIGVGKAGKCRLYTGQK
jgi:hypothetical protein